MTISALRKLYTANHDNEVVLFATNLKTFVEALNALEPNSRNYAYYDRQFKKNSIVPFKGQDGKEYKLQLVFDKE